MKSAGRFPGVDPRDGKLKWYVGDTFTLRFPIELTLVDLEGKQIPYNVYPTDVVKTIFRTKLEKDIIHVFENTNIKNNEVDLVFTPEITKKFDKGDYIIEMKLYGNENNFYYPTKEDFEKVETLFIDTSTIFSANNIKVTPGEIEMIGSGVVSKSTDEAIATYGQLKSNYVFPIKIYIGKEYSSSRVSVVLEDYENVYYNDIVDTDGFIHFLFDAYNFVGGHCSITISSGLFSTLYYEFMLENISFQDTTQDYLDDIDDVKVGSLALGHTKTEDGLSTVDTIVGNITYTIVNNEKKAITPLWTRVNEYFGQTVQVSVDGGEKTDYTVEMSGRLGMKIDTNNLEKEVYTIEISQNDAVIKTIEMNVAQVSPVQVDEYDKDNIPSDCLYVSRCAYHNNYTRCPYCVLKDKSRENVNITKTLLSDSCNEVQVL